MIVLYWTWIFLWLLFRAIECLDLELLKPLTNLSCSLFQESPSFILEPDGHLPPEDILGLQKLFPKSEVTRDLECHEEELKVIFDYSHADSNFRFSDSCVYVFLVHGNRNSTEDFIFSKNPSCISKVFSLSLEQNRSLIYEHYYSFQGDPISKLIEIWSGVILTFQANAFEERRSYLKGAKFKIGLLSLPMFNVVSESGPKDAYGFSIDVLNVLQERMKFDYEFVEESDSKYGERLPNGTWTSLLGKLQRKEIHFSVAVLGVVHERYEIVDFVSLSTRLQYVIMTWTIPGGSRPVLDMFNADVKILGLTTALLLVTFSLVLLPPNRVGIEASIGGVLNQFGALVSQGASDDFAQASRKILLLSALIFGWFALNVFSARLISNLSIGISSDQIKSLQDIETYGFDLFINGLGSELSMFKHAPDGSLNKRLWDSKISRNSKFFSNNVIDSFVENKDLASAAVYLDILVANWVSDHSYQGCQIETRPISAQVELAFGFNKNFKLQSMFDYQIRKMDQSGVLHKLKQKWLYPAETNREYICSDNSQEVLEVDFGNVFEFFKILIVGTVISLVSFCLELLKAKIETSRIDEISDSSYGFSSLIQNN